MTKRTLIPAAIGAGLVATFSFVSVAFAQYQPQTGGSTTVPTLPDVPPDDDDTPPDDDDNGTTTTVVVTVPYTTAPGTTAATTTTVRPPSTTVPPVQANPRYTG